MSQQLFLGFDRHEQEIAATTLGSPSGYRGLYAFHKYWGKKPHELLAFIIQRFSREGDIVLDPFVGSGTTARESLLNKRRFIGCDVNPIAQRLTRILLSPPSEAELRMSFLALTAKCKQDIAGSYSLSVPDSVATHYLWENGCISKVWSHNGARRRLQLDPTNHDLALSKSFDGYNSSVLPALHFFKNARINADPSLGLRDIFTGRAIRNIDLLLESISSLPYDAQEALLLCLTAASGQMSKMVFAVTNRGKTRGETADKIEVGSWVIGYWRPALHFEVNVWNCFSRRVEKLLSALSAPDPLSGTSFAKTARDVIDGSESVFVDCADCRKVLADLPASSVDLVITDPPHSDRIPYLELSSMWNCILRASADFDQEIVVSNAKERGKSLKEYSVDIRNVLSDLGRVLKPRGFLIFLFNARNPTDWAAIQAHTQADSPNRLHFLGAFPAEYSAGSVVQDNREGGLKHDYALVFRKGAIDPASSTPPPFFLDIPGWATSLPEHAA
jgi:SAM-dependent methyltransferase